MIEGSPRNMMIGRAPHGRPAHIKTIGPHQHSWQHVGRDGSGEVYEVCSACGTRRAQSGDLVNAKRQDWLHGGPWDQAASEPENETEAFAFPRKRGRPPKNGGSKPDPESDSNTQEPTAED